MKVYNRGLEVIMSNHHTRKWMWELLENLGWRKAPLSQEPLIMAAMGGQQMVAEEITIELRGNHFEQFIEMQQEAHNREVEASQKENES